MSPQTIQAIYGLALVAGLAFSLQRGIGALFVLYAALLPWFGLQIDLGLTLTGDRFVAATILGAVYATHGLRGFRGFGAFWIVAVGLTMAQAVALPAAAADYPPLKGEWRWVFQIVNWTLMLGTGAAVAAVATIPSARRIYGAIVLSCSILACLGVVQMVVYYSSGTDILPIGILGPTDAARSGLFETSSALSRGGQVFRASALGGEPKHLAYSLMVGLTILATDAIYGGLLELNRVARRVAAMCIGVGLVATFSTQGLILAGGNLAVLALTAAAFRSPGGRRWQSLALAATACGALALLIPGLLDALAERTVVRLSGDEPIEDSNIAVLRWLQENPWALPTGVGLGNVHLFAAAYIPRNALEYMRGQVFVAKAGVIRLVSETGIVGSVMFVGAALRPVMRIWKSEPLRKDGAFRAQAILTLLVLGDFMLAADGPVYLFLVVGISWAFVRHGSQRTSSTVTTARALV